MDKDKLKKDIEAFEKWQQEYKIVEFLRSVYELINDIEKMCSADIKQMIYIPPYSLN